MKSKETIIKTKNFEILKADSSEALSLPYIGGVRAGFPSPANDFAGERIDIYKECVPHPESTYFARVTGDSMNKDFLEGDLLIIDASLEYRDNQIAMIYIDGEYTMKRIKKTNNKCFLLPSNDSFPLIEITPESNSQILGIITWSFRKHI
ncbi:MAG: translesion error-prone DNA polymerase V autoproteolytic subunit [Bacteroidales bacterium]|nr:translesion error-prone DNA polymerase V autoproteolytic subunit [Bacteroidales bacterium]MDD4685064.1 translesion error-prone DNA polymerase V autoproteolytic subunit [Bacteroidales bacterium]